MRPTGAFDWKVIAYSDPSCPTTAEPPATAQLARTDPFDSSRLVFAVLSVDETTYRSPPGAIASWTYPSAVTGQPVRSVPSGANAPMTLFDRSAVMPTT